MGEVYRARDTRLDRTVAIKVLPAQVADDPQFRDRFEREAKAVAALTHPHICTLHDVGETSDGHAFLVMELLQGETLQQRLTRGPLDAALVVDLGVALADGLDAAHRAGIVHRDIKPANIFLTTHGPKILDFGLAKAASLPPTVASMQSTMAKSPMLTEPGRTVGTVAYMSPEQLRGEDLDERTDLFSLGLVLYEMATGRPAFAGTTSAVISAAILHTTPLTPRTVRPDLPAGIENVILKAIEKDRHLRYQHASDIHADLQRLKGDTDPGRAPTRVTPGAVTGIGRPWKVAIAAVAAVLSLSAGAYVYAHRTPALTDKDTIVLADFTNTTGDAVFDGTLRQGLAFQIEQSPFLKIMDDEQVQQNLRLMSVPPSTRITNQIAHDICVRDAAAATIDGSIASLGKSYVVTLQAIACQGGATLAREQIQADDKEHVLQVVGSAATAMRAKLGESRSSIQRLNRPVDQDRATTGSLEALQNFAAGRAELTRGRFLAAVPLFERAITLDPDFATAYYYLSLAYNNAGDPGREAEYKKKAFGLIDRVSDYERNPIAAGYYASIGDLDKTIDAWRVGIANYPRTWSFPNNLSETYITMGQFEEGLKAGQTAAQLQPNAEPPYRRLMDAYMCLDRLDEAKKVAESVRTAGIGGARIHQRFLEIAYIDGDQAAVAKETQWYAGKPEEYLSFGLQAAHLNVLGQRTESSKLYKRAAESALRRGLRDVSAGFDEANARADSLSGNCRTAHNLGGPALALAMCGDAAQAEKLAGETSKLLPNGTIWNAVELPQIRAAIELQRDQPAKAIELLTSASPYERAYPGAVYLRGLAYLRLHKGARPQPSSGRSWVTKAPVGEVRGSIRIGDCTIRFPTWAWRAAPRSQATRQTRVKPFRSSSRCGRMPTRISLSWSKPGKKRNKSLREIERSRSGVSPLPGPQRDTKRADDERVVVAERLLVEREEREEHERHRRCKAAGRTRAMPPRNDRREDRGDKRQNAWQAHAGQVRERRQEGQCVFPEWLLNLKRDDVVDERRKVPHSERERQDGDDRDGGEGHREAESP